MYTSQNFSHLIMTKPCKKWGLCGGEQREEDLYSVTTLPWEREQAGGSTAPPHSPLPVVLLINNMLKKRERENVTLNQSLALHAERMRIWKKRRHRLTTFVWSPGSPRAWGSEWLPVFSQPILFPLIWLNIKWTKIPISVEHFPHVLMMVRRACPEPTNQGYLCFTDPTLWNHLCPEKILSQQQLPPTSVVTTHWAREIKHLTYASRLGSEMV